jgi:osmotically-inducible protein OsmY
MKRLLLGLMALGGVAVAGPAFAEGRGVASPAFERGDSPTAAADNQATAAIASALDQNPRLRGSQITVANQGGTVTLTGSVPSVTARSEAEDTARATGGVVAVTNMLRLLVSSPQAPVAR